MIQNILKTEKQKKLLLTIIFYLICFPIFLILEKIIPSKMCSPGLGVIFIYLFLPLIILFLIVRNIVLIYKGHKENIYSLWTHVMVILIETITFIIMVN